MAQRLNVAISGELNLILVVNIANKTISNSFISNNLISKINPYLIRDL